MSSGNVYPTASALCGFRCLLGGVLQVQEAFAEVLGVSVVVGTSGERWPVSCEKGGG